jgi:SAM-dependent methyltransferase
MKYSSCEQDFMEWSKNSALGRYIRHMECNYFHEILHDIFGFRVIQLGCADWPCLKNSRICHQYICANVGQNVQAYAHGFELPFQTESVDVLILPHGLDLSSNPHQMMREVFRVLIPEGRVVLTGFNPVSLWGIRYWFSRRDSAPWDLNFFSLGRVKDWFNVLGFELCRGKFMGYALPFDRYVQLEPHSKLEYAGDRWWPHASAIYGLEAIKRVHKMTPILKPKWRKHIWGSENLGLSTRLRE